MLGLIQRVSGATVVIDGSFESQIGRGILLLLGIEKDDDQDVADRLLHKVLAYRIFPDDEGRMNLSLSDTVGDLLVVSQFTLAADINKGLRPSFSSAMPPAGAESLVRYFVGKARELHGGYGMVACGRFGADMQVSLVNDGPVTFMLRA